MFAIARDLTVATLAALWLWPALAVARDVPRRLRTRRTRGLAVAAAVLLPVAGPVLYGCLRPAETLAQRRARRLRGRLLVDALEPAERCLDCRAAVDPLWLRCPACAAVLRNRCTGCGDLLRLHWSVCPHCAGAPERGLRAAA